MDSGCLGNHVSVPATTSGGPGGDTGEGVCLGRSERAVLKIRVKRSVTHISESGVWK